MTSPPYSLNIFVNCPFDSTYKPVFEAIVFAISDCGFIPRCALENSDSDQVRISKIEKIISECKYGIHDISKADIDEDSGLARFNMPFELGLFLGAKRFGDKAQNSNPVLF